MEKKRGLGYICPECGAAVYGERTEFSLQAAAVRMACQCGKSELTAQSVGDFFRITVPCGLCKQEHRAEVPAAKVLQGEGIGLACPDSGQLCCYIGDVYRVQQSMQDLALLLQKQQENGEDAAFVDDIIMYEILSELKDIAARDGISCACGSKRYDMQVHGAAVDLVCRDCGGRLRLPAATDEDLDRLCCQYRLTIGGGK